MNTEDMAMLDRIERLAFQAGVASRDAKVPEAKPKPEIPEVEVVLQKLKQIGIDYPTFTGTALTGSTIKHTITWEEIIALSKVI